LNDPRAKEVAFGAAKQFLESLSQIIKDAYIPMAATLLGVAPALFGKRTDLSRAKENFSQKKDDTELLGILKTLLEKPNLVDTVLDAVDIKIFGTYTEYFNLLIEGKMDHPLLMGLQINEEIHTLSEDKLLYALRKILIRHYKQKLKMLPRDTSLSSDKKVFLIRKLRTDIIPRLEKGELITYEAEW
jgi:DNA primase